MEITVKNMRGCRLAQRLKVEPFTIIAGLNGSGKTSTIEAIGAAFTGIANIKGLPKKDLGDIVTDGTKEGSVLITGQNADGKDFEIGMSFPKGQLRTEGTAPHVSGYAAGIETFFDCSATDRAALMIRYLKAAPTLDDLARDLADVTFPMQDGDTDQEAANKRAITELYETIRIKGWDPVYSEHKSAWTRAKGAWEQISGERYGAAKVQNWKPADLDDDAEYRDLVAAVEAAEAELAEAQKGATLSEAERDRLQAEASNLKYRKEALEKARAELGDANTALAEAEAARAALPSVDGQAKHTCPCCNEPLNISVVMGEVKSITKVEGEQLGEAEIKKRRSDIAKADGTVANTKSKINDLNRRIAGLETEIAASEKAEARLAEIGDTDTGSDDTAINAARDALTIAKDRLKALKAYEDATAKAAEIARLEVIGKAIAPDGTRQRKLLDTLDAFNDNYLAPVCTDAGWRPIVLTGDLDVTYSGRRYDLISESEQWRCRVAMQIAMARLDRSEIVIIDGADVLDIPNRRGLFRAASKCGLKAIIAATFSRPEKAPALPPEVGRTYWIENGETRLLEPETAAKAAE